MRYRRRTPFPDTVEAMQFCVMNLAEVMQFVGVAATDHTDNCIVVKSRFGLVPVVYGDYVLKDGHGFVVLGKVAFERQFVRA